MDRKHNKDKINKDKINKDKIKEDKIKDDKINKDDKIHIEDKIHKEDKNNIEIWEDLVYIRDLLIALLICVSTTFFGYFIAPNEAPKPLFFGLIGAIIGFIITSIIINPKREFVEGDGVD